MKRSSPIELDRTDLRILDALQRDGALSAAELADRVGLAVTTCWRRVKRLEDARVIRGRVALLDREQVGLGVTVFAHVKLTAHGRDNLGRFEQGIRRHPEVLECYTLMGDWDFLLRIVARDIKAYEAFFLDHLSKIPGVQSVSSSIAMTVVKETTQLPLDLR
jgi:Lrp/AsnC family transcriptional regulator